MSKEAAMAELPIQSKCIECEVPVTPGPGFQLCEPCREAINNPPNQGAPDTGPEWACCGCGNIDPGKYKTIRTDTTDGTEYDMECLECGGNAFEESPWHALKVVTTELDTVRAELEALKESIKNELR
jgi:hypothetical protein